MRLGVSHRARPGKGNLLKSRRSFAAALTEAVRDAALVGLGRGMLLFGGWTGNGAGGLWLNERCGCGEVRRRMGRRVPSETAIGASMPNIVPYIRKRVIWVKNAQRAVGLVDKIRIEWLGDLNAVVVSSDAQQIPAFENIGQA